MNNTSDHRFCLLAGPGNSTVSRPWEHHHWVEPYRAAVLERTSTKVAARISAAESAIKARLADTKLPPDKQELDALQDALRVLFLLNKEEL